MPIHPLPVPSALPPVWQEVWIGWIGSWVLRLLALTLRLRLENPARLEGLLAGGPLIFVFWHNRLLFIPMAWHRFLSRGRPKGVALTSTSRDGNLIAQFLERFGINHVRGSATRRGSTALRELVRWLARGHDIGISPDGSRGPLYEIKPGLVLLAQLSGRPVLPLSFEFSRAWRLGSWDHFFIPKPFSTVTFRMGEPHHIARTSDSASFEHERQRCEQAMMAIVSEH